jgi:hypothetical protein
MPLLFWLPYIIFSGMLKVARGVDSREGEEMQP